jgi:hypothetical protein
MALAFICCRGKTNVAKLTLHIQSALKTFSKPQMFQMTAVALNACITSAENTCGWTDRRLHIIVLENLTVVELDEKYPACFETKVCYCVQQLASDP